MQRSSKWPQIVAGFSAALGALGHGCGLGWSSPTLPYLVECEDKPDVNCTFEHEFTEEQGSWIGSAYSFGCLASGLATGVLLKYVGRKWSLLIMSVPFTLGWVLLTLTKPLSLDEAYWFYIARAIAGFGGGAFAMAVPIYVMEIADQSIRGSLGILMQFMLTFGLVYTNAAGAVLDWKVLTGTCIFIPILTAFLMIFMPESPYMLLKKGKDTQAKSSLQWLRGKHYDITEEVSEMQKVLKDQQEIGSISPWDLLRYPMYLKPFLLMLGIHFVQQFCGVTAIVYYLSEIFLKAGLEVENSLNAAAIVASSQVVATGLSILIVERVGRRILLMLSSSIMFVAIFSLGAFFYLEEHMEVTCGANIIERTTTDCVPKDGISQDVIDSLSWLPLVSLIVYKFAFALGYGPLAWMMLGEFFSLEAKEVSSAIVTAFNWTCSFLVTKFGVNIENSIGTSGLYFMFSVVCFFATFFVLLLVPETRGRSADEMKQYFAHGRGTSGHATLLSHKTIE